MTQSKQDPPQDTLTVSLFRLFVVTATGGAVKHVPKVLPLLIAGGLCGAVIFGGFLALAKILL